MNAPDVQFRPIPLTIVDLIAILFPGILWLLLFVTTYELISQKVPLAPWDVLNHLSGQISSWPSGFGIFVTAALIGYAFKPLALETAESLVRVRLLEPIVKMVTHRHFRHYANKMRARSIRFHDLKFPFDALHSDEVYFIKLQRYFEERFDCKIDTGGGYNLFMFVKRHLRLISPAMWEECERLEAEVRMSASMLLAATYSLALAVFAILRYRTDVVKLTCWGAASLFATCALISGFMHTRDNEVSYAYVNCLLVVADSTSKARPYQDSTEE
jgi:hypothetical protein